MILKLLKQVGAECVAVVAEGDGRKVIAPADSVDMYIQKGVFLTEKMQPLLSNWQCAQRVESHWFLSKKANALVCLARQNPFRFIRNLDQNTSTSQVASTAVV